MRPAPMFRCPTSEFPICPSGKPTDIPEVPISTHGYSEQSRVMLGVLARAMALSSERGFTPQPSRIISSRGCFGINGLQKKLRNKTYSHKDTKNTKKPYH